MEGASTIVEVLAGLLLQEPAVQAKTLELLEHCCRSADGFADLLRTLPCCVAIAKLQTAYGAGDLLNPLSPEKQAVQQLAAAVYMGFLAPDSPRAGGGGSGNFRPTHRKVATNSLQLSLVRHARTLC